jgi:SAM-dependent methyltransferase
MSRTEHPDASTHTCWRFGGFRGADDCPPPSRAGHPSPPHPLGDALHTVRLAEERVYRHAGLRLENLHVLEIGTRQDQRHLRRLSVRNEVVGIDIDTTNDSFHLGDYLRSLRDSSAMRAVKSLSEKMLGVGRTSAHPAGAVARELGLTPFTPPRTLRMSASNMSFDDATFGFVCSFGAFERMGDPGEALREVVRVLRPGGVAYICVAPYTAPSGHRGSTLAHDDRPEPPFWPHLRAELEHTLHPDSRLNRLSAKEWRLIFSHIMPGVELVAEAQSPDLREPLARLRAGGELTEHSDEDLLTARLVAIWKKRRVTTLRPARPAGR